MKSASKVIVSVSSDLNSDQRVQKICTSLLRNGYDVTVVGRLLDSSKAFSSEYKSKRFRLIFNRGSLFYANLNLRLFLKLMIAKAEVFYANDLDVLPANYLAAKLRRKHLVYDSHEYFTEVPELASRPSIQRIWERIEQWIVPNLKHCITVTPRIASIYYEKYKVEFKVVRNFPRLGEIQEVEKLNYLIYQGALNVGRGLEELIEVMPKVNAKLWIAGSGDIESSLKEQVVRLNIQDKVVFLGRQNPKELKGYTQQAKLGLSIEKKIGLNYTYALPNKVFDYLHALTPVLHSDLVEVKDVLKGHDVGEELRSYDTDLFANQINEMLTSNQYDIWKENCKQATEEFNWQQEEKVLLSIFEKLSV